VCGGCPCINQQIPRPQQPSPPSAVGFALGNLTINATMARTQARSAHQLRQLAGAHCGSLSVLGGVDVPRGHFEHATGPGRLAVDTGTRCHATIVRCRHWVISAIIVTIARSVSPGRPAEIPRKHTGTIISRGIRVPAGFLVLFWCVPGVSLILSSRC
jgi:hypothetical protein